MPGKLVNLDTNQIIKFMQNKDQAFSILSPVESDEKQLNQSKIKLHYNYNFTPPNLCYIRLN